MGRLYDLKLTLPRNIADNAMYPNVEYVIVDYNSNDGLAEWIRLNYMHMIKSGTMVHVRTTEPKFFSMTHSRNIGFLCASGDIVNNVDADNYTKSGFAAKLNEMANGRTSHVVFVKSKRLLRGRIGFFRYDFVNELGGYDEDIKGYGADDRDIYDRAGRLGYSYEYFGGVYVERIKTSKAQKVENMEVKNWRQTENQNKVISADKLAQKIYRANQGRAWGSARVIRNFERDMIIAGPH
jgi:glycosyltransferase involved in cell wall biosynthesis